MPLLVLFALNTGMAQTPADLTLSSAITSISAQTATHSIIFAPGFSVNGSNGAFSATIIYATNSSSSTPSNSQNFIQTFTPRIPITDLTTLTSKTVGEVNQTIQYVDGLGRPVQTVQFQASPTGRDVAQPVTYDQFNRQSIQYLPYTNSPYVISDGSIKTDAIVQQTSFYNSGTTWAAGVAGTSFPRAVINFETSPLNRVIDQSAPGDAWQLTGTIGATNPGHTIKTVYATNNASSLTSGTGYWAKNYGVNYLYTFDGHYTSKNTLTDLGNYPADNLYILISKNNNWSSAQSDLKLNTTETYMDQFERVILKRTYNYNTATLQTETLSTYYVYDSFGNLTYVLPPGASPDAGGITQAQLDTWCYQYRYDGRNRQVEKKIPGKGWELTLYNYLDQAVAVQDSVQRMKSPQEWTIIKHDAIGRNILTGIYQYSGTSGINYRATLQTLVDAQSSQWETTTSSGNGYTSNTWPTTWTTTLTLNYYDNYTSVPGGLPYNYSTGSNMTRGELTATKTAILNTPTDMLWALHYYDDKNRLIKGYQQHYFGGLACGNNYDDILSNYDFSGNVLSTTRKNYVNGSGNTLTLNATLTNSYAYDQVGRKTKTFVQINNGTNVLLSQLTYNEIGQPYRKQLHSEDNGTNFIEAITYSYNPRGWITEINSANFDEKLYYDNPSGAISGLQGIYNGNILEAWYNSPSIVNKGFAYNYDYQERLISSKYYQSTTYNGALDEGISYDLMGNISQLTRGSYGSPGFIYSGTFSYPNYSGNQINTIVNNGNPFRTYTYDGNGNSLTSGAFSYDYNMLNLPYDVKLSNSIFNTYTYAATGQKLRKISNASTFTTDYVDGIQYKNGVIDFIETDEGRYENSASPNYQYDLKDHLGNVRVIVQKNTASTATAEQENEYYAFGLNVNRYDNSTQNKYLYNHKELQDENLLNQFDYGARFYDPTVIRWNTIDPLAEKSRRLSPYNYGENNPVSNIDPDGMETQVAPGVTLEWLQMMYGSNNVQVFTAPQDIQEIQPPKKKIPSFAESVAAWDKERLKKAPHLKPLKHWWQKALVFLDGDGYHYNGIQYDNNGNPIGVIRIVKMEMPMYVTGPESVLKEVQQVAKVTEVAEVAEKIEKGTVVLGRVGEYEPLAQKMGAKYFHIANSVWEKMNDAQRWAKNVEFLDKAIANGNKIILSNSANSLKAGTFFAREVEYLIGKGYKIAADGMSLFK